MSKTASVPTELAEEMFGHGPPPPAELQVPVVQFKLGEDRNNTIIHWESNLGSVIRMLVDAMTIMNNAAIMDKINPIEHDPDWQKRVMDAYQCILDMTNGLLDEQEGLPAIKQRTEAIQEILAGKKLSETIKTEEPENDEENED